MTTRFFVPALAAALSLAASSLLATATFAAQSANVSNNAKHGTDSREVAAENSAELTHCTELQQQVDQLIKSDTAGSNIATAKALRMKAGQLCASGNTVQGIAQLEQALGELGQKPTKAFN